MYVKKRMNVLYLAESLKRKCLKTIDGYLTRNNDLNTKQVLMRIKRNSTGPLFSIIVRLAADKKYYIIPKILDIIESLIEDVMKLTINQREIRVCAELISIVIEISWSINHIAENFLEDRFVIDETIASLVRINKKFISTVLLDDSISDSIRKFLIYGEEGTDYEKNTPIMRTTQMLEDIAWRASYKNLDYVINVVFSGVNELMNFVANISRKTEQGGKKYMEDIIGLINGWHIIMGAYAKYSKDDYMLNQSLKSLQILNSCEKLDRAKKWAEQIIDAHPRWVLDRTTLYEFIYSIRDTICSQDEENSKNQSNTTKVLRTV